MEESEREMGWFMGLVLGALLLVILFGVENFIDFLRVLAALAALAFITALFALVMWMMTQ